uniref:Ribosome biogenesis protein tsr1 n=1 Tax=Psilocybe cubensis TaxID=181762 RepID=A0A8H7Y4G9_PSICU
MHSTSQGPEDEDDSDALSYSQLPLFDPEDLPRITTEVVKYNSSGSNGGRTYNQYLRGEKIGKGKHGDVYVCRDQEIAGYELAMKVVRKSNNRDRMKLLRRTYQQENPDGQPAMNSTLNSIRKEIALMQKLRHANVVRLVEVLDSPSDEKIYIGGPVEWCNDEHKAILTLQQTRRIIRDTILGLEYLHYEGIIHRDIKPANILYTPDRRSVKIIDFGVAHYTPPSTLLSKTTKGKLPPQHETNTYHIDSSLFPESDIRKRAGTPSFLAPEVVWFSDDDSNMPPSPSYDTIAGRSNDRALVNSATTDFQKPKTRPQVTKAIDIWSLGVTFYCLLFGHTPFTVPSSSNENMQRSEFVLYNIICTKDWPVDETMGSDAITTGGRRPSRSDSEGYWVVNLLDRMLQKDPQHRASLQEIKENPWILKGIENPGEWVRITSPSREYDEVKSPSSRIARPSPKASTGSSTVAQSRLNRRNNAKQSAAAKRNALVSATRIFNGVDGAPRIVAVIPLTEDVSAKSTVQSLADVLDMSADDCPDDGIWKMKAERFRTSLQFRTVPYRNFYSALDACKVADYVVFVLSSSVEVDPWGDTLLRTLQAQGLPEVVSVISPDASIDVKSRTGILKSLLSFVQYFVPTQTRVFDLHASSDRLNALRSLSEGKPSDVRWKEGRTWILGETTEWEDGTLKLTGVARGSPLSANRLVHIPNFGDFQVSKILSAPLPRTHKGSNGPAMDVEPALLAEADPTSADSLVSSNDPEDLQNEQTWPTEEEMKGGVDDVQTDIPDAVVGTTPKAVRRIPKGMSEYQAAWIIDEDDDEEGDETNQSTDEVDMETQGEEEEEMQDMPMDDAATEKDVRFEDLDMEEEEEQLNKWRNRQREEEDDQSFPDEIDTPKEIPARTRFQRYRGMRSFRTSPWDAYENLPRDYARIFQFEDFKRTERSVRRRAEQELNVVEPGARVTLYIKDVPQAATSVSPIILFSVLQHEHKVTVLNFTVQRNTEYDGSVRSKDPLILCVGPRRLAVNPIYSQHTRGGGKGANNVHKFERYLRHGVTSVATTYGPVIYGRQPCVLLRETPDAEAPQLVAMGTFMNPDTTRIIAKRIILTGHPFKVHKKTATIRYMFFNPDDVHYFKPIQLHTKHGRTGHIRESLGTHGYFKAYFDGPINQMDTVCMSLYKRVFPKWARLWTQSRIHEVSNGAEKATSDAMEE